MDKEKKVEENPVAESEPVVLTQIEKLNNLRVAYRNADIIWKCVTALVIVLAFVFVYFAYMRLMFSDGPFRFIISILFLLAIPFCLYILPIILKMSSKFKAYNEEYKNNFLQEKIHAELPKADYKAKEKISIKEISECTMIKKSRSANANDCIEGSYKGVDFLRYDMELSYKTGRQVADCVLIACANKTQLKSEIQIVQRDFKIGKSVYEMPEGYTEYNSPDEDFNKKFVVYTQSQEEATGFIDKELIKKISKFSGGGPIAAFFDPKKVYLIVRRKKDSMEAPVYKKVKESACKKAAEKETNVIKNWLEILNDCVVK